MKKQPPPVTPLAHNIRLIRDFNNKTRDEFAVMLKLKTGDQVYTYESARSTIPKPITLERLADLSNIPVEELINKRLSEKDLIAARDAAKDDIEVITMHELAPPYSKPRTQYDALIEQQNKLLHSLNKQSETANTILNRIANNVEVKVESIDLNLNDALARMDSLKMDIYSGRQVMLQSLARLEKKPVNALLSEADNITISLLSQQKKKQSRTAGKGN